MSPSEKFITKYEASGQPYVAEVIAALRDGSARVTHVSEELSPAGAPQLLQTYEARAKHLLRFSTPHAARLRRDVESFCVRLREKKNGHCIAWIIERDPHFLYDFWEWASDGSFIGSIKAVDDRKISASARLALWGEKRSA